MSFVLPDEVLAQENFITRKLKLRQFSGSLRHLSDAS